MSEDKGKKKRRFWPFSRKKKASKTNAAANAQSTAQGRAADRNNPALAAPVGQLTQSCNAPAQPIVHARLALVSVSFGGGHSVDNDTWGNFTAPHFEVGRAADPVNQLPAAYPYCYTRNKPLRAVAVFRVTQQPTQADTVYIQARATAPGVNFELGTFTATVSPGQTQVVTNTMIGTSPLPDHIANLNLTLAWYQSPPDAMHLQAGSSTNQIYVTLADPVNSANQLHWTMLDISCSAANGQTTVHDLRLFSNMALASRTVSRKRDGHGLTYWNPNNTNATNAWGMLARPDGSGQCGAWANFLLRMWRCHGDDGGHQMEIEYQKRQQWDALFLVKNWTFHAAARNHKYGFDYFVGRDCVSAPGVPGQRNPNPPPAFYNHFTVWTGTQMFDPSYGSGPFNDKLTWETASIDGLSAKWTDPYQRQVWDTGTNSWVTVTKLETYRWCCKHPNYVLLSYRDMVTNAMW